MLIKRPFYIEKTMRYSDTPVVKFLLGVRRCGKTSILEMIKDCLHSQKGVPPERIVSCRFDSLQYLDMTARELFDLIRGKLYSHGRTYLFLDEVQNIPGWGRAVKALAEDFDTDVYIAGSDQRLLPHDLDAVLPERFYSINVFPLTFSEYLDFKSARVSVQDPHAELARYLRLGGFPALNTRDVDEGEIAAYISDVFCGALAVNLFMRSQVRKPDLLRRVIRYVLEHAGSPVSAKAICDALKAENRSIDNETVESYLSRLEEAFLLHRAYQMSLKADRALGTRPVWYPADHALARALLGHEPDSGKAVLENAVYLELRRRGYTVYQKSERESPCLQAWRSKRTKAWLCGIAA